MQKIRKSIKIGENLRILRKDAGLTQKDVVAKLQLKGHNTDRNYYSRYETGELNIPINILISLKEIFCCSFDDIFDNL